MGKLYNRKIKKPPEERKKKARQNKVDLSLLEARIEKMGELKKQER